MSHRLNYVQLKEEFDGTQKQEFAIDNNCDLDTFELQPNNYAICVNNAMKILLLLDCPEFHKSRFLHNIPQVILLLLGKACKPQNIFWKNPYLYLFKIE